MCLKVLATRGSRQVQNIQGGSSHTHITMLSCGSTSGTRLPPFILYKGKNLYTSWTKDGPASAMYGMSSSGWMDCELFYSWFSKMFVPAVRHLTKTGKVVLFFDGHYSHLSLPLIEKARSEGIILQCLPPNATHVLQPLDVGVFGPMKKAWKIVLQEYKLASAASCVDKSTFPKLLARLYERAFTRQHLVSAFKGTGLFPLNKAAIQCPTVNEKHIRVETEGVEKLREYFTDVLHLGAAKKASTSRKNAAHLKPRVYGKALTSDEIYEQLVRQTKSSNKSKGQQQRDMTPEEGALH